MDLGYILEISLYLINLQLCDIQAKPIQANVNDTKQKDCEKKCPLVDERFIAYCNMHKYLQETVLRGQGIGKCNEQNMHRVFITYPRLSHPV